MTSDRSALDLAGGAVDWRRPGVAVCNLEQDLGADSAWW
jgi:hypothetical protein